MAFFQSDVLALPMDNASAFRQRCSQAKQTWINLLRPWPSSVLRERHNVYVIELAKDVLSEAKFKKANPGYLSGKPCVYVGMTGYDPDTRFDQHKANIKSNKYALKYGLYYLGAY
jgi:hypothetical protein